MSEQLKPCPFCGCKGRVRIERTGEDCCETWVEYECEARGPAWEGAFGMAEQAVVAANQRAIESALATVSAEPEVVAWALILNDDTGEWCADVVKGLEQAEHWRDEEMGRFVAMVWRRATARHEVRTIRPLTYAAQEDSNRGE